jgi:hypothetical protein
LNDTVLGDETAGRDITVTTVCALIGASTSASASVTGSCHIVQMSQSREPARCCSPSGWKSWSPPALPALAVLGRQQVDDVGVSGRGPS